MTDDRVCMVEGCAERVSISDSDGGWCRTLGRAVRDEKNARG